MNSPFDSSQGLIILPVRLWAPGGDIVLRLALDTGAIRSLISLDILVRVGYDLQSAAAVVPIITASGVEHIAQIEIEKLEVLGQERRRFLILCHNLPSSANLDGLLGLDFFRGQRLVIDFRADAKARETADEYMFGPAFLVSPVATYKARSRPVYLPAGANWYDFWSGASHSGGQTIEAPAPYDSMPLYIRAGSIVPFGPEIQYTAEKKSDPITLFIYQGSDGAFTLYEDDGLTYNYEKGMFARIPLHWDDAAKTLTIGKRQGSFEGALSGRTFNVVFISKQKPVSFSFSPRVDRTVQYSGDEVVVKLN